MSSMASNGGHLNYDENLAEMAPAATKAQLQSGYNPDLLQDKPATSLSSRQDLTLPTTARNGQDVEKQSPPPHTPFHRTTKGILIILLAAAVVIGAVVGGAVGGTRNHHANNVVVSGSQAQGAGAGGGGQSVQGGAAASATSGASTDSVSQSTVGASSTDSGQSQAQQTGSATPSSSGLSGVFNPGGPFAPITTGSNEPAPSPSAGSVVNQEIGFVADVGH